MSKTSAQQALFDIINCYEQSPYPSFKVSNYFPIYAELFEHLRGSNCTFIETGVLDGGSLFMWRNWLGPAARIVGIDLNPGALKWQEHGFDIYIGDQGDPEFWRKTLEKIGEFDVLLDDGGHQSFQQIVTVNEAIAAAKKTCLIVIEDTCTSFMKEFASHGKHSFLEYSKCATDMLTARAHGLFPGEFKNIKNTKLLDLYKNIQSIQFYSGIVSFKISQEPAGIPRLVRNSPPNSAQDFRYDGKNSAIVLWPDPFDTRSVLISGGRQVSD